MTCTTATATARDFPAVLSAAGPTAAPVGLDAGDEVLVGRRFPYSMVGDWVMLAPISDRAVRIYWALRAHVNTRRGDDRAWPAQRTLAEILRVKKVDTVIAALRELQAIGAIEIETVKTRTGRRNIYTVHEIPPDGYTGPSSTQQFHARRDTPATPDRPTAPGTTTGTTTGPVTGPAIDAVIDAATGAAAASHAAPPEAAPTTTTVSTVPTEGGTAGRACPATARTRRTSPGHGGYPKNREYPPTARPRTPATPHPEGGVSQKSGGRVIPDFGVELTEREPAELEGGTHARHTPATPPPVEPNSGPSACGAPHPDHRPEPDAPARVPTRPAGKEPETLPEDAQEVPDTDAGPATRPVAAETVSGALSALEPASAAVTLRPEPGRPETWKCDRHLATPDPEDRPCRSCKTVREHCEHRDTQLRLDAATARTQAARAARAAVKACTWCDDHGDVLNPATGHCYEPVLRCDHTTTTPGRAAEIAARPAPAPVVATAATRAAAIAAFRNRHRPDQTTPTAA